MSRRRYRWDTESQQMVEIGADWTDAPRSTGDLGKFDYDNLRAPDGADISSRTKYRDYLKATGSSPVSDFKETTAKVRAERESRTTEKKAIREAVGRALYQQRSTQRNRR